MWPFEVPLAFGVAHTPRQLRPFFPGLMVVIGSARLSRIRQRFSSLFSSLPPSPFPLAPLHFLDAGDIVSKEPPVSAWFSSPLYIGYYR